MKNMTHREDPGVTLLGSPRITVATRKLSGVSTATPANLPPKVPPAKPLQAQAMPFVAGAMAVARVSPPTPSPADAAAEAAEARASKVGVKGGEVAEEAKGRVAVHWEVVKRPTPPPLLSFPTAHVAKGVSTGQVYHTEAP